MSDHCGDRFHYQTLDNVLLVKFIKHN